MLRRRRARDGLVGSLSLPVVAGLGDLPIHPVGTALELIGLSLEQATEMIAERVIATREATWEEETEDSRPLKRTLGIHFLGGATLDSEENYLIKKFFTAMGALSIENQARI